MSYAELGSAHGVAASSRARPHGAQRDCGGRMRPRQHCTSALIHAMLTRQREMRTWEICARLDGRTKHNIGMALGRLVAAKEGGRTSVGVYRMAGPG